MTVTFLLWTTCDISIVGRHWQKQVLTRGVTCLTLKLTPVEMPRSARAPDAGLGRRVRQQWRAGPEAAWPPRTAGADLSGEEKEKEQ